MNIYSQRLLTKMLYNPQMINHRIIPLFDILTYMRYFAVLPTQYEKE